MRLSSDENLSYWIILKNLSKKVGNKRRFPRSWRPLQCVNRTDPKNVTDRRLFCFHPPRYSLIEPVTEPRLCPCKPVPAPKVISADMSVS